MKKATTQMRILNLEPLRYSPEARDVLARIGIVNDCVCSSSEDLRVALQNDSYNAILTRLGIFIGEAELNLAPDCRWIVTPTTGTDHIDCAAAVRRGVDVISLRPYADFLESISATSELTWCLLLALQRKLPFAFRDVLAGNWRREPFLGNELEGKTLGILGCGRLGRKVARYGFAFGMNILVHDIDASQISKLQIPHQSIEFASLFAESDVISVHLPLNSTTESLIGNVEFAQMRPSAVLINTARGAIVDSGALLDALKCGKIAGAAIDVLGDDSRWNEDHPPNDPLVEYARHHDNLLITPHIGGYASYAVHSTRTFIAERLAEAALLLQTR